MGILQFVPLVRAVGQILIVVVTLVVLGIKQILQIVEADGIAIELLFLRLSYKGNHQDSSQ